MNEEERLRISDRKETQLLKAVLWASLSAPGAVIVWGLLSRGLEGDIVVLPGLLWILLVVSGVAFAHAILIGLPLYVLLAKRWRIPWWMCALAGAVIGGVPMPLLLFNSLAYQTPSAWDVVTAVVPFAGAGLIGGAVFGIMVARTDGSPERR